MVRSASPPRASRVVEGGLAVSTDATAELTALTLLLRQFELLEVFPSALNPRLADASARHLKRLRRRLGAVGNHDVLIDTLAQGAADSPLTKGLAAGALGGAT